jgi:hypothetical protein
MGSHEYINPQWGRPLQREGARGRGHAQRRECARGRFRPLNEKLTRKIFATRLIGPFQAADLFLQKAQKEMPVKCTWLFFTKRSAGSAA